MSKQALLNINLLAARKGAAELEFAVKKVHSLDSSKGTPDGYIKAIEKRVEELVFEEVMKFQKEDNFLSIHKGHIVNNSNITLDYNSLNNFLKIFEIIFIKNHLSNLNHKLPNQYILFKKNIISFLEKNEQNN